MPAEQPAKHRWVVDSIEESAASLEVDGDQLITVPRSLLPNGTRQGHVLTVTIEIDEAATKQALADSAAQVKKGGGRAPNDPGGDVAL